MSKVWVSPLNTLPSIRSPFQGRPPVRFYDTTLRDGEQTVGVIFTPEEKLLVAHELDRLGISRIEAGFPRVSDQDREAFSAILKAGLRAEIWGFSRALVDDLDLLIELGVSATIIEVPASRIKLEAYGLTPEKVVDRTRRAVDHACRHGMKVLFFPVDGTRAELDFLKHLYQAAFEAGATEAAIVDTIGACSPEAAGYLVTQVKQWLGQDVPLHFHGHNDFGLATASAIAAVAAGADWIQGTINGMGERAGNADLAEVALALSCLYDVEVALDLKAIRQASQTVCRAGGYRLDSWKPLVGENLFTRESGAVANQFHIPEAIEPYSADLVGAERRVVLGKKSGLANLRIKADQLNLDLAEDQLAELLSLVKQRSVAQGGLVSDEEFAELVANRP